MKNKKDLIAQIAQNLVEPSAPADSSVAAAAAPMRASKKSSAKAKETVRGSGGEREAAAASRATNSGKQAAFWLDDEDRAIFHETGMLLYSQGIKPSHNLVLRAAIRMIPRDHRLVEKVRELIEKDGRKVRHQKNKGSE